MISDCILDMMAAKADRATEAQLRYLYDEAMLFRFDSLSRALDAGNNADIRRELRLYWLSDRDGFGPVANARKNANPFTLRVLAFIDHVDWLNGME